MKKKKTKTTQDERRAAGHNIVVSVSLPIETAETITAAAARLGISKSEVVRRAINRAAFVRRPAA